MYCYVYYVHEKLKGPVPCLHILINMAVVDSQFDVLALYCHESLADKKM
jgi:hypothetical protein